MKYEEKMKAAQNLHGNSREKPAIPKDYIVSDMDIVTEEMMIDTCEGSISQ